MFCHGELVKDIVITTDYHDIKIMNLNLFLMLWSVAHVQSRPMYGDDACVTCDIGDNGDTGHVTITVARCSRQPRQTFLGDTDTPVIKFDPDNKV